MNSVLVTLFKIRNMLLRERILLGILFVASLVRFYNYQNRWALAYDQAWFAVIARHALETFQIPLLGPFASGGPFQTGGEWFWIVMVGILLNPFSVISPWVFITILSIAQVGLLFLLGKELINRKFGYIAAILCAVSTSQTLQATNLTNQMTSSICATLFLLFMFRFMRSNKRRYLFLSGVSVGLSSAIHLQGILLLPALLTAVIVARVYKPKDLLLIALGLALPWVPVLIADSGNKFYNTTNMLTYFIQPQSQISYEMLGRRWLTFIGIFIPHSWGRIIGGYAVLGYIQIGIIALLFVRAFFAKTIKKEWWIILISTIIIAVCLRYIRTPIYENYITFLHPFVLLLTSWMIWTIWKVRKRVAYILLLVLCVCSVVATLIDVRGSTNITAKSSQMHMELLVEKYPGKKFLIYDYKYNNKHKSLSLVYFMQTGGFLSDDGLRIGVAQASAGAQMLFAGHKAIVGRLGELQLYDLSASSSASLEKAGWLPVNPSFIYDSVQHWYKKD